MAGIDPISLAIIGGVGGAIINKDDPIKGALMGAGLGFGGASLLGAAGAGATAGASGALGSGLSAGGATLGGSAAGSAAAGSLGSGLTAGGATLGGSSLGGMTAAGGALEGALGSGLTATGAGAAAPGTLTAWNAANAGNALSMQKLKEPLQLARMGLDQQSQNQNRTVYAPPQMRAAQMQPVDISSGVQGLLNMRDPQDARRRRMASLSLI